LPAVPQTKAFHATAAPGDERLHLLQTSVILVALGVHESGEPAHALRHAGGNEKHSGEST
jgi:hypothetical protein